MGHPKSCRFPCPGAPLAWAVVHLAPKVWLLKDWISPLQTSLLLKCPIMLTAYPPVIKHGNQWKINYEQFGDFPIEPHMKLVDFPAGHVWLPEGICPTHWLPFSTSLNSLSSQLVAQQPRWDSMLKDWGCAGGDGHIFANLDVFRQLSYSYKRVPHISNIHIIQFRQSPLRHHVKWCFNPYFSWFGHVELPCFLVL